MADSKKKSPPIVAIDPVAYQELQKANLEGKTEEEVITANQGPLNWLMKSIGETQKASRLSFEVDPTPAYQTYAGVYRTKSNLTPDHIIKRITGASGDDLVCQIIQARANHIAAFGRPRLSRFSIGYEFQPMPGVKLPDDDEEKKKLQDRLERAKKIIWNCGMGPAQKEYFTPNFSQYLKMIVRDAVTYGRNATEILSKINPKTGKEEFYGFRASDAGTMYHIVASKDTDDSIRRRAIQVLQDLKNEKISPDKYARDVYKWVQVIDGIPRQAFSDKEMIVHNHYPTTNIEYNGYPLTPIDQALNAITTHINISIHNKLYFQNGRAARGMLIFKSDQVDEKILQAIRLQFHQSINSSASAWRMPVFGCGPDDEISWQSIDVSGRDAEFQFLMDSNARSILSAFQMSPEELPGYGHLSRGSNSQALSESNNEYRLEAQRDVGIRPLLGDVQDFLNSQIVPLIDPDLVKTHHLVLAGLDKDDPEKESTRLQQDMQVHLTFNDVLQKVEKDPIAEELGGNLPLNQTFLSQAVSPYLTVGEILENFFKRKGAAQDPRYNYVRDQFWLSYQQILLQKAQAAMQSQMAQQQSMMQEQMAASGQVPPQEDHPPEGASETQKKEIEQRNLQKKEEWLAQNYMLLEKTTENNGRKIGNAILKRHKEVVDKFMKSWEDESKKAVSEIAKLAGKKKSE